MVKNHNLAKSITDAGWYQFRVWVKYFGYKFGKITQRERACGSLNPGASRE